MSSTSLWTRAAKSSIEPSSIVEAPVGLCTVENGSSGPPSPPPPGTLPVSSAMMIRRITAMPPPPTPIGTPPIGEPRRSSVMRPRGSRFHLTSGGFPRRRSPEPRRLDRFEGAQLARVALELLALGRDDLRCRVLHEPLVAEHPLGALDLLSQPLDLGLRVPVRLHPVRLDDRVEDAPLLCVE